MRLRRGKSECAAIYLFLNGTDSSEIEWLCTAGKVWPKNNQRKNGKGKGEGEQGTEREKERKITSKITTMEMQPQNTGVLMWKMHNLRKDN